MGLCSKFISATRYFSQWYERQKEKLGDEDEDDEEEEDKEKGEEEGQNENEEMVRQEEEKYERRGKAYYYEIHHQNDALNSVTS